MLWRKRDDEHAVNWLYSVSGNFIDRNDPKVILEVQRP